MPQPHAPHHTPGGVRYFSPERNEEGTTGGPRSEPNLEPKWLQNGSQSRAFWAPKSELYSLWEVMGEKLLPKKQQRKKVAKSGGLSHLREFLQVGGGGGVEAM